MDLSPKAAKKKITGKNVIILVRCTFLIDLIWLPSSLLPASLSVSEEAQSLAALCIAALILGSKYLLASDEVWGDRLRMLRAFLGSKYGRILSGLFAAGITLEVLSYVAEVFALDIIARSIIALMVGGIVAVRFNVSGFSATEHGGKPPFSPILMATIAVRIAALLTTVIASGPLRYLAWGFCVLNIPSLFPKNGIGKDGEYPKPR